MMQVFRQKIQVWMGPTVSRPVQFLSLSIILQRWIQGRSAGEALLAQMQCRVTSFGAKQCTAVSIGVLLSCFLTTVERVPGICLLSTQFQGQTAHSLPVLVVQQQPLPCVKCGTV